MAGLCSDCKQLFNPEVEDTSRSVLEFKRAILEGCPACKKAWNMLTSKERNQIDDCIIRTPGERFHVFASEHHLSYFFETDELKIGVRIRLQPVNDEQTERLVQTARTIESKPSAGLITHWIRHCIESHPPCNLEGPGLRKLPTRLISIGIAGLDAVKLCHTGNLSPQTQYYTLSHSWGVNKFLTLTSLNLNEFLEQIPLAELTQTFQDAVSLTKACRIGYLWIDSLCIIQDSLEDWEHESALMAAIYSNANCNIAADSATGGRTGLFRERDPERLQPQSITFPKASHPQAAVKVAWEKPRNRPRSVRQGNTGESFFVEGTFELVDESFWTRSVLESDLAQRAWVFQERLLAKRVIHFTETQLFYECRHQDLCEVHPEGLPPWVKISTDAMYHRFGRTQKREFFEHQGLGSAEIAVESALLLKSWDMLVFRYSKCELTYDKDRLIAFSGVAKELQRSFKCDYLAGLWRNQFHLNLLWMSDGRGRRPETYTAPTWSWASVMGIVHYSLPQNPQLLRLANYQTAIGILDSKVETVNGDQMSMIVSASVRLTGRLIPMPSSSVKDLGLLRPPATRSSPFPGKTFYYKDVDFEEQGEMFYVIPVIHESDGSLSTFYGLCLKPMPAPKGEFRRFGLIASIGCPEDYLTTKHTEEERNLVEGFCEEYDEATSKCTITIV